jgi:hypothetical protein
LGVRIDTSAHLENSRFSRETVTTATQILLPLHVHKNPLLDREKQEDFGWIYGPNDGQSGLIHLVIDGLIAPLGL